MHTRALRHAAANCLHRCKYVDSRRSMPLQCMHPGSNTRTPLNSRRLRRLTLSSRSSASSSSTSSSPPTESCIVWFWPTLFEAIHPRRVASQFIPSKHSEPSKSMKLCNSNGSSFKLYKALASSTWLSHTIFHLGVRTMYLQVPGRHP